ncbi:MAG: hypothetical protein K0B15_15770 [Lentimicrobium sp.]|nr:hypothetical protein [Lentimicrobium sp.]
MFNTSRMGKRKSYLAWILVFLQFLLIGLIVFTSPLTSLKLWVIGFILTGLALGLYSIYTIRIGNFNISPHVKPDGHMVAHGPYRLLRHPMYTAIMLTIWPMAIGHFSYIRLAFAIILTIVLIVKLHIEEEYLMQAFIPYREYSRSTYKLIPFIW